MKLFNTLSEKKEELAKSATGDLRMFVCGPTVYDYPHIGNARTYVAFDLFVRYLRAQKWNVNYLQNITDVDDRIIRRAVEEKSSPEVIAKKFEDIYHANEKALGITSVTEYARATDYIPQIVKQVETLIEKGYAYKIEGDGYYFDITKFADYGNLAKRTVEQAEDGVSRIDESVEKKNRGDFVLWKLFPTRKDADINAEARGKTKVIIDGEPAWDTTLGWGRPGWHIEDTAITEAFFGPQYDLHGGAVDLKFPHHEAEIAQQEAASGKSPLVKLWMHTGFLLVNGEKMSKSKGNFITIEDFLKKHSAEAFRWMVASYHYRSPMNYTEELIGQAESAIITIQKFFARLRSVAMFGGRSGFPSDQQYRRKDTLEEKFDTALEDDFNTPLALAVLFSFIDEYMKTNQEKLWMLPVWDAERIETVLLKCFEKLGFIFEFPEFPKRVVQVFEKRKLLLQNKKLRNVKDYSDTDALRKEIEELGYKVEDHRTIFGDQSFIFPSNS